MDSLDTLVSIGSLVSKKLWCNVHVTVYAMNDLNNVPVLVPKVPVQLKIISNAGEIMEYKKFPEIRKEFWKFTHFLNKGSQIYLAFANDDLAGFYILADMHNHKPYLYNYHPLFGADSCYFLFFGQTIEKYRRNGISSYVTTQMCKNSLGDHGIALTTTNLDNIFSQKGLEKAGFNKIGTLRHIQFFQLTLVSEFIGYKQALPEVLSEHR